MKRTKIIATVGPASTSPQVITAMHSAGANAFRINLSHGNPEQWSSLIKNIRSVAPNAPILLDTAGPEVRLLNITHPVELSAEQEFVFHLTPNPYVCYTNHPIKISSGQIVVLDDGAISLRVEHVVGDAVYTRVINEGVLTDRRKVAVPSSTQNLPILTEDDINNVQFGLNEGADVVALSFTQSAQDIQTAREIFGSEVMIIAKIENHGGVENIEQIIHASDGIMIARGDLGVEIPLENVPQVQKLIAKLGSELGKPVIVATQMLESMTKNSRPTRAEVSDVANAILDGADAVMLSGETAMGLYPARTVQTMAQIAQATDAHAKTVFEHHHHGRMSAAEAISSAVYEMSEALGADAIISATSSGFTARMVARFRPQVPIIAVAHDERTMRLLHLTWGVTPCVFIHSSLESRNTIVGAVKSALAAGLLQPEHLIIATAGVNTRRKGSTNLIEIHRVKELIGH